MKKSMAMQVRIWKDKTSASRFSVILFTLIFISLLFFTYQVYLFFPFGGDWKVTFRPAALELSSFRSPYNIPGFFNAPWLLIPLIPLAVLPEQIGYAFLYTTSVVSFATIAIKLGAKPLPLIAFLLSYPVLFSMQMGQVEWLVMLGFLLPPSLGLFLLLAKPQVGMAIAVFYLADSLRKGGFKEAFKTFWPVSSAFGISFLLFGFWPAHAVDVNMGVNSGLWPHSIPVGLVLLFISLRTHNIRLAMISAPFLSPYVPPHGWTVSLLGLLPLQAELVLASLATWVVRALTSEFLN
jgi:hypothetical protein